MGGGGVPGPLCQHTQLIWQDPTSEERFHVELHFSPGVKGCEEDSSAPAGSGFRPASAEVSNWLGGPASVLEICCCSPFFWAG